MTYPNDNQPVTNMNRRNNWGAWAVLAICVVLVIGAVVYYADRHNTTASNQGNSPATTTTGSSKSNPGAPKK